MKNFIFKLFVIFVFSNSSITYIMREMQYFWGEKGAKSIKFFVP